MKVFNVGNKSVNLYLLDSGSHRLLIDTGFPNQLHELGRAMRETGYTIKQIDFTLVTHFHVDHAGAIQELKNEGVQFLLPDIQSDLIPAMETLATRKWKYTPLIMQDNIILAKDQYANFLQQLNFDGAIIATPGHTADSISVVFNSGETFTGDLTSEHIIMDEQSQEKTSWQQLKAAGAKIIYPGHGHPYVI